MQNNVLCFKTVKSHKVTFCQKKTTKKNKKCRPDKNQSSTKCTRNLKPVITII